MQSREVVVGRHQAVKRGRACRARCLLCATLGRVRHAAAVRNTALKHSTAHLLPCDENTASERGHRRTHWHTHVGTHARRHRHRCTEPNHICIGMTHMSPGRRRTTDLFLLLTERCRGQSPIPLGPQQLRLCPFPPRRPLGNGFHDLVGNLTLRGPEVRHSGCLCVRVLACARVRVRGPEVRHSGYTHARTHAHVHTHAHARTNTRAHRHTRAKTVGQSPLLSQPET